MLRRAPAILEVAGATGLAILVFAATAFIETTRAQASESAVLKVTNAVHDPGYEPKRYLVGDEASIEATIRNVGTRKARGFTASVLLSTDKSAGADDQEVEAIQFPAIKPGKKVLRWSDPITWPASINDGFYYFVVCPGKLKRCAATKRFELYDLPEQILGEASGNTLLEFSGGTGFGDPMEQTSFNEWSLTFTLERVPASEPDGGGYAMVSSTGTETTSGDRTTEIGDGTTHCEWSSDEETFTDIAEGGFGIDRDASDPMYDFSFRDYESSLGYMEQCTQSDGFSYEQERSTDSAISCCEPVLDAPFENLPISGAVVDYVVEDETFNGDLVTRTYNVEWDLSEPDDR